MDINIDYRQELLKEITLFNTKRPDLFLSLKEGKEATNKLTFWQKVFKTKEQKYLNCFSVCINGGVMWQITDYKHHKPFTQADYYDFYISVCSYLKTLVNHPKITYREIFSNTGERFLIPN